jgi:hypothetical protein
LTPSDRSDIMKAQRQTKDKRTECTNKQLYVKDMVAKLAPDLTKPKAGKLPIAIALDKVKKVMKKKGDRWWNTITPDCWDDILQLKPQLGVVKIDLPNGRYFVHHRRKPGSRKSFSWSKIGSGVAAAKVLVQLWSWDCEITGADMPLAPEMVDVACM